MKSELENDQPVNDLRIRQQMDCQVKESQEGREVS